MVNIVDDEFAAGKWLPPFAAAIGAPTPPMGEHGGEQGASNWKAGGLGWNRCTRPGAKGSRRLSIEFSKQQKQGFVMNRNIEVRSIEELADIGACHAVMMELRPHMKDADLLV